MIWYFIIPLALFGLFSLILRIGRKKKAKVIEIDRLLEVDKEDWVRYVSNCCGAYPKSNGDNDSRDYGICSDCGEHCEYVLEDELTE